MKVHASWDFDPDDFSKEYASGPFTAEGPYTDEDIDEMLAAHFGRMNHDAAGVSNFTWATGNMWAVVSSADEPVGVDLYPTEEAAKAGAWETARDHTIMSDDEDIHDLVDVDEDGPFWSLVCDGASWIVMEVTQH